MSVEKKTLKFFRINQLAEAKQKSGGFFLLRETTSAVRGVLQDVEKKPNMQKGPYLKRLGRRLAKAFSPFKIFESISSF